MKNWIKRLRNFIAYKLPRRKRCLACSGIFWGAGSVGYCSGKCGINRPPTAAQVIRALLAAVERTDILLDSLNQTYDVTTIRNELQEAVNLTADWENRE